MFGWTTSLTAVYPDAVELAMKMPIKLSRPGWVIRWLTNTEIPDRYPASLAKLLIRLGEGDYLPYMWHGAKPIIDQLLQTALDCETKKGLKEIIAKFGL